MAALNILAGIGEGYMRGSERNARMDAIKQERELRQRQIEKGKEEDRLLAEIRDINQAAERQADVRIEANRELARRRTAIGVEDAQQPVQALPESGVVTTPLPPQERLQEASAGSQAPAQRTAAIGSEAAVVPAPGRPTTPPFTPAPGGRLPAGLTEQQKLEILRGATAAGLPAQIRDDELTFGRGEAIAPPGGAAAAPPPPARGTAIRGSPADEDIRRDELTKANMQIANRLRSAGRVREAAELEKLTKSGVIDEYNQAWTKIGRLASQGRVNEAAQLLGRLYNSAYDDGHDVFITPVGAGQEGRQQFEVKFVDQKSGKPVRTETIGVDQLSTALDALDTTNFVNYRMNQDRLKLEGERIKTAEKQADTAAKQADTAARHAEIREKESVRKETEGERRATRTETAEERRATADERRERESKEREEKGRLSTARSAVINYFKDREDKAGRERALAAAEKAVKAGKGGDEAAAEVIDEFEGKGRKTTGAVDTHLNQLTRSKGMLTREGTHLEKSGHPEIVAALKAEGKLNVGEYRRRLAEAVRSGKIAAPATEAESSALPAGTIYIAPNGSLRKR